MIGGWVTGHESTNGRGRARCAESDRLPACREENNRSSFLGYPGLQCRVLHILEKKISRQFLSLKSYNLSFINKTLSLLIKLSHYLLNSCHINSCLCYITFNEDKILMLSPLEITYNTLSYCRCGPFLLINFQ